MTPPLPGTPPLLRLLPLHLPQTNLLLRERGFQRGMPIMPLEALNTQLLFLGRENGLPEPFDAEFADERQARGREEHLLAHGRGIRDVGYGDEGRGVGGGVAAEEDVEGLFWGEVRGEKGEVGVEGGGGGVEDCEGEEGLLLDSYEEAALGGGGDEGLECGVQFLGCWTGDWGVRGVLVGGEGRDWGT